MPEHVTRILHFDDNRSDGEIVARELKKRAYPCTVNFIMTEQDFRAALERKDFDVILCDFKMAGFNGDQAFALAREFCPEIPFILVTGELGEEFVIERLKKGVTDYILKDNLNRLVSAIDRAVAEAHERRNLAAAECRLHESEERLRFHIENSPLAVVEWGNNYVVTRWSKEAEQLFGWSAREILGRRIDTLNLIFPPDIPIVEKTMMRLSGGKERTVVSTNRNVTKAGKIIECTWYNSVLIKTEGTMESVMSLVLDITERKQAEELLRKSERQLRQIIDLVPHFIFAKDMDGRFILVNRAVAEAYGATVQELTGKTDADFAKSDDEVRHFREDDLAVLNSGKPKIIPEEPITDASGRVRILRTTKIPFTSFGATSPAILGVSTDITELKRAEEVLRTLNAELEHRVKGRTEEFIAANKELESFTYSVSHDLKAPLRAISGYANILLDAAASRLTPEEQRYLSAIAGSAGHLGMLVNHLLTFSRLNKQPIAKQPVDMQSLAEAVVKTHREAEPDRSPDRSVDVSIAGLFPAQADPTLIRQVMENLVSNAFKYTRKQPHARIEIGSRNDAGETLYWIKDNGVGFDMQYYDKLFGVFQRLHDATEYEGTGVGLAFAQRIIERHGGKIWAESSPGNGAMFFFTLPAGDPK